MRAMGVAIVCGALGASLGVRAAEPGDLWESTMQMTMSGQYAMSMPARTQKICKPRGEAWTEPPAADDKSKCTMTNVHASSAKMTWDVECTQPPARGTGEIVFQGRDAYSGTMTMTMSEGTMTMKLSGKRVGDCDYTDTRNKIADIQRQAAAGQKAQADAMVTMCTDAAKSTSAYTFLGPNRVCDKPEYKTMFCESAVTEKGYVSLAGEPGSAPTPGMPGLAEAMAYCGNDEEDVREKLCARAVAAESYAFPAKYCPEQVQDVAERECAGRKYTSIDEKYRVLCSTYAQRMASDEASEDEAPPEKETPTKKGKKLLKGLFGK